jgi:hypothetical protein
MNDVADEIDALPHRDQLEMSGKRSPGPGVPLLCAEAIDIGLHCRLQGYVPGLLFA